VETLCFLLSNSLVHVRPVLLMPIVPPSIQSQSDWLLREPVLTGASWVRCAIEKRTDKMDYVLIIVSVNLTTNL